MKWKFNEKVDITIGEAKNYKGVFFALSFLLVSIGITSFIFRNEIYNYFVKPDISLLKEEVEINIGSEFNPRNYLVNPFDLEVKISNFKNEIGEQEITYQTKDKTHKLKLIIKDKEKPKIKLKRDLIVLNGGDTLNVKEQVEYTKDNYSKNLKITYPTIDYRKSQQELIYIVEDEAKNKEEVKLQVVINQKPKEKIIEKTIYQPIERPNIERPSHRPIPRNNQPYINGTRNHTVNIGTTPSQLANILTNGVIGSGYVSINYSSVNLTKKGNYNVIYSSNDGVKKAIIVTVR